MYKRQDLACLIALQADPRASWRELGAATGIAERTVARRIKRLMDADALRVIAEADPLATGRGVVLHAWVRCRSGRVAEAAEALATLAITQLVVTLAGTADLMAELTLADAADMPDVVTLSLIHICSQAQGDLAGHQLRIRFGQQAAAPFGNVAADGFVGGGLSLIHILGDSRNEDA